MKRFLFATLIAASAFAQPQPVETVTVSGTGRAVVTPDQALARSEAVPEPK